MIFGFATANAQEHIKRVTPWHWSGFNTIEDKASVGEVSKKLAAILDVGDCTETMLALLRIFTQSSINILPPEQFPEGTKNDIEMLSLLLQNKLRHPFSIEQYKDALRTSWTAEQIGHLLLKYESEWYADDALSKWNEIDNLFEDEKQQKKKVLEEDLDKAGIIKPHERNYALEKLDEAHEIVKSNWQIEKEQRIKPSLWWKKVAELQAQATQSTNDNQIDSNGDTPQLTNLSTDGKAWFIHPVAMVGYFNIKEEKKTETWDRITNSRVALLHPAIRQNVIDFINDVESSLNVQLRVTDGYRTIEEQNILYDQGRKNPGPMVTKVKGGYSFHNYGLAIDVVKILDKKAIYLDNTNPDMTEIVRIAKSYGSSWGGDWTTFKDYPHFEFKFGFTTTQLLEKYNNGDLNAEGYVNVN